MSNVSFAKAYISLLLPPLCVGL